MSLRIANCSGFYGDKLSAAKDMVESGPIDVLTGDYLAELTMTILYQQRAAKPDRGYVGTFLKQLKDVMVTCKQNGIKIVNNAGGLNPAGMAGEIEKMAAELGIDFKVAYIDGDDLMPRMDELKNAGESLVNMDKDIALAESTNPVVTANAYLGAWGIKEALDQGADIVICPRVTDAAVVIGPAAWKYNWQRDNFDALAGAVAAGHIIECGAQATGGNYSFFQEVPSFINVGFPIADIEEDGSFTLYKHPGTGGLVSVGTVTAQLLYEINTPAYLNPDVIAHFDTLDVKQTGDDRVYVSGCRGSSPTNTHKVCINTHGGFRNGMDLILTGLDIPEKAEMFCTALFEMVGGKQQFDAVDIQLIRSDKENPISNEEAYATLKVNVKSNDQALVGRVFSAKIIEMALASFPGFASYNAPSNGRPYIVYWPALVDSKHITENVHFAGSRVQVKPTSQLNLAAIHYQKIPAIIPDYPSGASKKIALGRLFGTRSGDKGGCANLGVWAKNDAAYGFLHAFLTTDKLKQLLPDTAQFRIERHDLANINSINFFIHDILGEGVSSSVRIDSQAKTLGEYLRAKIIDAPASLVDALAH